jgi:hypothetical protein
MLQFLSLPKQSIGLPRTEPHRDRLSSEAQEIKKNRRLSRIRPGKDEN